MKTQIIRGLSLLLSLLLLLAACLLCIACGDVTPDESPEETPEETAGVSTEDPNATTKTELPPVEVTGTRPDLPGFDIICAEVEDEYHVDDVTITISYGLPYIYSISKNPTKTMSQSFEFSSFKIKCHKVLSYVPLEVNEIVLREVNENLVSDKYGRTENGGFLHSEEITIPREMFEGTNNVFSIRLVGENLKFSESSGESLLSSISFVYERNGDMITFTEIEDTNSYFELK